MLAPLKVKIELEQVGRTNFKGAGQVGKARITPPRQGYSEIRIFSLDFRYRDVYQTAPALAVAPSSSGLGRRPFTAVTRVRTP